MRQVRRIFALEDAHSDLSLELLGYDGSPTTFTQLIDADPTLSLRHAGFKGKAVDISSLPNWYWREEACQDWVSDFATTYLRMNSWQAREVGERFEGTGRGLYCMHKENWSTILGSEKKGEVIYAFLVKASREKGVVPSGIVIGHQTDLKG